MPTTAMNVSVNEVPARTDPGGVRVDGVSLGGVIRQRLRGKSHGASLSRVRLVRHRTNV